MQTATGQTPDFPTVIREDKMMMDNNRIEASNQSPFLAKMFRIASFSQSFPIRVA